jgi:tRNA dimethylallyltransferase
MNRDRRPKLIVIAGPTASGKTSLGVKMSLSLGGEVISGDSMQVYRGMDIGTAKPTTAERRGVHHHLLDVVNPDEEFDAAKYRSLALRAAREIHARNKVCLVVGGTGLYIKALLGGLLDCPRADSQVRESLKREGQQLGAAALHKRLRELDPETADRIHPNDTVRITRALEIVRLTGQLPSRLARRHEFRDAPFRSLKIFLHLERERLYQRIDERTVTMIRSGLIEETRRLLSQGYPAHLKPMQAIGYRHIVRYLQGEWSLDHAVANLQKDTRRFAKRQLTWFRADPEGQWISGGDVKAALDMAEDFLGESS